MKSMVPGPPHFCLSVIPYSLTPHSLSATEVNSLQTNRFTLLQESYVPERNNHSRWRTKKPVKAEAAIMLYYARVQHAQLPDGARDTSHRLLSQTKHQHQQQQETHGGKHLTALSYRVTIVFSFLERLV